MSDDPKKSDAPADGKQQDQGKATTFDQAEVDRIVEARLAREREATRAKYADYDDLKAKAAGAKTAEERIAELAKEVESTKREALRRRVQATHSISDEDADLFLTGTDEETLTSQAKRLAARDADRKAAGNRAPFQGRTPTKGADDPMRDFTRGLFGRD